MLRLFLLESGGSTAGREAGSVDLGRPTASRRTAGAKNIPSFPIPGGLSSATPRPGLREAAERAALRFWEQSLPPHPSVPGFECGADGFFEAAPRLYFPCGRVLSAARPKALARAGDRFLRDVWRRDTYLDPPPGTHRDVTRRPDRDLQRRSVLKHRALLAGTIRVHSCRGRRQDTEIPTPETARTG